MPRKYMGREQRHIQSIHVTGIPYDIPEKIKAARLRNLPRRYLWQYYEDAITALLRDLNGGATVEVVETTRRRRPVPLRLWLDEAVVRDASSRAVAMGWTMSEFVLTALSRQVKHWEIAERDAAKAISVEEGEP